MIADRIKKILDQIENIKNKTGFRRNIKLIAVTKTVSVDRIKEAINCGITDIGENRVQEAEQKIPQLVNCKVTKHLIGHLQTNKVKKAVLLFDVIQSVDSFYLLEEINKQAEKICKIQECFVEIKISEEATKYGLNPMELEEFMKKSAELKNIKITGLMAMAPYFENPELTRPYFHRASDYYSLFAIRYSLSYMSMGMTNDFGIAIEEGANMVRIGTGIFGERL
ncbi:MAG: YggS family pyridoxal phosphate-dependent enzyme [Elusimicrobiota bacterium]